MKSVAAFGAAVIVSIACAACGPAHGASGSSVVRPATSNQDAGPSDVPETLAAATAAAQANIDRFTAGDYAGVWEHMESDVRAGISQRDFVTFYETCKKPGARISVRGLRLEDGEAVVVMKIQGVEKSRGMVYEDGRWNMQATDDFAARLGQPLPQLIAEETAAGLCSH
ncbi:hypothetical protein H7K45_00965 [Mycobacterium yunnanensis]|uniref:Lipoprotein n=1 Tax=Mycobacterium yunnanensis TaxID=368477 RepID=A0A9X3BRM4_9MYCO|nr:hypothetical protein [Mycobacterium yunnanensis]MCV7419105.1 hypothetical protein [Mycobacterium yunnanensis]